MGNTKTLDLTTSEDYPALEKRLAEADLGELARAWGALAPLRRLVVFKLLDAPRALELYRRLPFSDRYFLLCGFPLQSIAPVLETLSPLERRVFVQLPRGCYEEMLRELRT